MYACMHVCMYVASLGSDVLQELVNIGLVCMHVCMYVCMYVASLGIDVLQELVNIGLVCMHVCMCVCVCMWHLWTVMCFRN